MAEAQGVRPWVGRLTWLVICVALVFVQLLPLDTLPRDWAAPDLLLVVTLVWVARRPDFVPAALIAALFLCADFLFQRPPGLYAALVVILTEMLRTRSNGLRNMPFLLEWASVALGIVAIALANRIVLAAVLTPQAPLTLALFQTVMSCLAYPLVAALAHVVFGVSRPAPGEVDALGHRL